MRSGPTDRKASAFLGSEQMARLLRPSYGKRSTHLKFSQEEPPLVSHLPLVSLQQNICMNGLHVHQLLLIIFKHIKGSRLVSSLSFPRSYTFHQKQILG